MSLHFAFESGIVGNQVSNQVNLLDNIDIQVKEIVDYVDTNQVSTIAGGIASGIAGGIAEFALIADNMVFKIIEQIDRGIAGGIDNKWEQVLRMAKYPIGRSTILKELNLSNHAKNFETYIQSLVTLNWLTMTIPNKPTSPKQQYITTLKGRLIFEFLKHQNKMSKISEILEINFKELQIKFISDKILSDYAGQPFLKEALNKILNK